MKKAFLITFSATTRIVASVPEGMDDETFVDRNQDALARTAREKMAQDLGDYLFRENMTVEADSDCPAGADEPIDRDPEKAISWRGGFGFMADPVLEDTLCVFAKDGSSIGSFPRKDDGRDVNDLTVEEFIELCQALSLI